MRAVHGKPKLRLVRATSRLPSSAAASSPEGMTHALWGLDWRAHFPQKLGALGIMTRVGSLVQTAEFMHEHAAAIHDLDPDGTSFLAAEPHSAKARYYDRVGDFFLFEDEGRSVGVFVGTAVDWASYYIRSVAFLPEYQGHGIWQSFLTLFLPMLARHGVERVEIDISPSNLGHLHLLNKLGFNVTGCQASERWGTLVHLTKFLSERHERVFLERLCYGVKPQLRLPKARRNKSGGQR